MKQFCRLSINSQTCAVANQGTVMLWIGGLLLLLGARAQLHVCESSLDNSTGAVLESKYVMKALPNTHCRPEGMDDVTYLRLRKSVSACAS